MVVRTAFLLFFVLEVLRAGPLIDFPTDNRALLEGETAGFFHVREPPL